MDSAARLLRPEGAIWREAGGLSAAILSKEIIRATCFICPE